MKDNKIKKPDIWYAREMFGKRFKMNQSMFLIIWYIFCFGGLFLMYESISSNPSLNEYINSLFHKLPLVMAAFSILMFTSWGAVIGIGLEKMFPRYYPES